jgi:hypothetical protein
MESPFMFNLSVLHVWFKTFGMNHPVSSTCQYFMSGSKLLVNWLIDWLVFNNQRAIFQLYSGQKVLNQTWSTDKLNIQEDSIQKFWIRHEEQTSWTYRVIPSKSCVPDIKYWQVEHTGWFNTKVWTRHEVLTNWTFRKIQSKSFESDMKNKQVEHTEWFNPKVLYQTLNTDKLNTVFNVWYKTFGCNHPVCSTCQYVMSGSKLGWNHPVCSTCSVQNFWMESSCMFNLSVLHVWFKLLYWIILYVQLVSI